MRSMTATQLMFDYSATETADVGEDTPTLQGPILNVPTFGKHGEVYAAAARRAGRMNAAAVSDEEYKGLHRERQSLLDKKFLGQLSRTESNRLAYVRWSLDRIDDARSGHVLDELEDYVVKYEKFLAEIRDFESQLKSQLPKKGSPSQKKKNERR